MIEVDRKSVSEPAEFTRRAVSATKTLRLHVVRGETFRKQNQLPLNEELLAAPDLLDALQGLFRGCCAFCETPLLDSEKKFAAHFRPRQRAHAAHVGDPGLRIAQRGTRVEQVLHAHALRARRAILGPRQQAGGAVSEHRHVRKITLADDAAGLPGEMQLERLRSHREFQPDHAALRARTARHPVGDIAAEAAQLRCRHHGERDGLEHRALAHAVLAQQHEPRLSGGSRRRSLREQRTTGLTTSWPARSATRPGR
jgi:hypothetical protein